MARKRGRRRRTLQGGNGRPMTYGGTPNAQGWGITNQYLGGNPPGWGQGEKTGWGGGTVPPAFQSLQDFTKVPFQNAGRPVLGTSAAPTLRPRMGTPVTTPPGGNGEPGGTPGTVTPPVVGQASPQDLMNWATQFFAQLNVTPDKFANNEAFWGNRGWSMNGDQLAYDPSQIAFQKLLNNKGMDFWQSQYAAHPMGGTTPPPGGGGGTPPVDLGDASLNELLKSMGMPLDPFFEAQRAGALNERDWAKLQAQNAFDVGSAQLRESELLGNRGIDEQMAARGLFGSGIERRSERLLGQDVAKQGLGLQTAYSQGTYGADQGYRNQIMQALMELAQRLQGQDNLPLPNTGSYGL